MPLPILHSAAGYSIYRFAKSPDQKTRWDLVAFLVVLANLADLDFLPGIFSGLPQLYHRHFSHSLLAAALCGLIAASVGLFKDISRVKFFLLSFAAYFSHLILDSGTGSNEALLWPFLPHAVAAVPETHHHIGFHALYGWKSFLAALSTPAMQQRLLGETAIVLSLVVWQRLFKAARGKAFVSEAPAFGVAFILLVALLALL